ncbi:MAG: pyrroline-5-carboxylate reductase [Actinomycetota bacterium]
MAESSIKLLIVGGGRMGEALLGGLLDAQWATPEQIVVVEKSSERAAQLQSAYSGVVVSSELVPAASVVIAVKPNDVTEVCRQLIEPKRVLSIAAGVTIASLQNAVGNDVAVIRAMPNTPALVKLGASAIAGGATATEQDLHWASEVLGAVGLVVRVKEHELDAVTGLSGSGPAYVFLLAESLMEAGVAAGLDPQIAEVLTIQTLLGASTLLAAGEADAVQLRAQVTSPNGTTHAGITEMENAGFRNAVVQAVLRATERSKELGS